MTTDNERANHVTCNHLPCRNAFRNVCSFRKWPITMKTPIVTSDPFLLPLADLIALLNEPITQVDLSVEDMIAILLSSQSDTNIN